MTVYEDILATAIENGTTPDHIIAVFAGGCIFLGALTVGFGLGVGRFLLWLTRYIRSRKGH